MTDLIGTRLGDFEIVRELGRGGMGVVYEARQLSLNRRVALKVLSVGLGLTSKAVQRFQREAEAAAKLHHTNIVPVYAIGEEEDAHFYAMELIDGPSLDHVIRQMRQEPGSAAATLSTASVDKRSGSPDHGQTGPYVPSTLSSATGAGLTSSSLGSGSGYFDTVARMIAEVADALEYAHQQGVIHRDIKPSNLLLAPTGRLSVNDFGLARMLEQPGMTMTGEFVGTPAYMSPEQITAGRIPLDHRTDIYSLGATLYEMLTLHPPFTGASREQVLAKIVQKEPRAPRKVNAKVPVDLETICLKCLEKDPDRRYQTAGEMAEDLRRYVNRFAISARRAGPITKLRKWAKRNPTLAAACSVALVALVMSGLFAYRSYRAEQSRLAQQKQHEEALRIERQERAFDDALAEALSGDPSRAENAFRTAEAQGVAAEQIRLLRGLVAMQREDLGNAIPDLELAVQRMPDSYAARIMLRSAYVFAGRWSDFERVQDELKRLQPTKPEDFIVRAWWVTDASESLKDLDEAIRKRDSLIARTLRVKNRLVLALDKSDLKEAEKALQEIQPVRLLLPDNPFVLQISLNSHRTAAFLHGEKGNKDRHDALLEQAREDAQRLKQVDQGPFIGDYTLIQYYRVAGDEKARKEMILRGIQRSPDQYQFRFFYAILLCEQRDFQQARQVLSEGKIARPFWSNWLDLILLADAKGPDIAYKAFQSMETYKTRDTFSWFSTLIFLGHGNEARAELRELRRAGKMEKPANPDQAKAFEAFLAYFCGDLSDAEFLNSVGDSRNQKCAAEWRIGMVHLANGDRVRAKEHFQKSVELIPFYEYNLSRVLLARLEQDPNWPPWIPVKKRQAPVQGKVP